MPQSLPVGVFKEMPQILPVGMFQETSSPLAKFAEEANPSRSFKMLRDCAQCVTFLCEITQDMLILGGDLKCVRHGKVL